MLCQEHSHQNLQRRKRKREECLAMDYTVEALVTYEDGVDLEYWMGENPEIVLTTNEASSSKVKQNLTELDGREEFFGSKDELLNKAVDVGLVVSHESAGRPRFIIDKMIGTDGEDRIGIYDSASAKSLFLKVSCWTRIFGLPR